MLILMHPTASPDEVERVATKYRGLGSTPHKMPVAKRIAVPTTVNPGPEDPAASSQVRGVAEAVSISKPWKLVSRETHPIDTVVSLPGPGGTRSRLGGGVFGIIAGPCAVETREQTLASARAVRESGGR